LSAFAGEERLGAMLAEHVGSDRGSRGRREVTDDGLSLPAGDLALNWAYRRW
jgi:hypothetical protein